MTTLPPVRIQFLITDAEYRANIRRQKAIALVIARRTRRGQPLEDWQESFLIAQRKSPVPNVGRGRPRDYSGLDSVAYAVVRTSKLSEIAPNLNPGKEDKRLHKDGRKRKFDYAEMALAVHCLMKFNGMKKTQALNEVAKAYGVDKSQISYAWKAAGENAQLYLADVD